MALRKRKQAKEKYSAQSKIAKNSPTKNLEADHFHSMTQPKCGALEALLQRKVEYEYANRVIVHGRRKTKMMTCTDLTFTFILDPS